MKPPKKLIQFLQKNPDCLKYFQYLQTQLDYDVKSHKARAERYRAKLAKVEAAQKSVYTKISADNLVVDNDVDSELSDDDIAVMEHELAAQPSEKKLGERRRKRSKLDVAQTGAAKNKTINSKKSDFAQHMEQETTPNVDDLEPLPPLKEIGYPVGVNGHIELSTKYVKSALENQAESLLSILSMTLDADDMISKARRIMRKMKYSGVDESVHLKKLTEAILLLDNHHTVSTLLNTIELEITAGIWYNTTTKIEKHFWGKIYRAIFKSRQELQRLVESILIYLSTKIENISCVILDGLVGDFPIFDFLIESGFPLVSDLMVQIILEKNSNAEKDERIASDKLIKNLGIENLKRNTRFFDDIKRKLSTNGDCEDEILVKKILSVNSDSLIDFDETSSISLAIASISAYHTLILTDDNMDHRAAIDENLNDLYYSRPHSSQDIVRQFDLAVLVANSKLACDIMSENKSIYFDARKLITANVINLERRTDRLAKFTGRAIRSNLLVNLACMEIKGNSHDSIIVDLVKGKYCGMRYQLTHAMDAHILVSEKFVEKQWDPSKLATYDKLAPKESVLVDMTASERACALSHISAWMQCLMSLSLQLPGVNCIQITNTPAWLILEDDATPAQNFYSKLCSILASLPSDYHICQIGYSRPARAPFQTIGDDSFISIPTFTFFMTGYLITKSGAQFLLQNLPVVGPIDTWINTLRGSNGLKGFTSTKLLLKQQYSDSKIGWRATDSDVFYSGHPSRPGDNHGEN